MSRQGMIAAGEYATELPSFDSLVEAERSLFAFRDRAFVGKRPADPPCRSLNS
jgi:hypothetical protein